MTATTASRLAVLSLLLAAAAPASAQWTVTILNPTGSAGAHLDGLSPTQQVGSYSSHAAVWSGTPASMVDLNPAVPMWSEALDADGNQQVGWVIPNAAVNNFHHAALWTGTAASFVDLNPSNAVISNARAALNGVQAGDFYLTSAVNYPRAAMWTGTAASVVDLHPTDWQGSRIMCMAPGQQGGSVVPIPGYNIAAIWSGTAASCIVIGDQSYKSEVNGCDGTQQVGYEKSAAQGAVATGAVVWNGTPGSKTYLNPTGAASAIANGVHHGYQVGSASFSSVNILATRAGIWHGTAASWEDLHALLPAGFTRSSASAIYVSGASITVVGWGQDATSDRGIIWTKQVITQCGPADIGGQGGVAGADGALDNNDFVVFVDRFFAHDPGADLGSQGGVHQSDGAWDNNDFVVFIDDFFAGC